MAKRKQEYGNDSISMLEGADRVRKRPGVIFGSDGLEGCEHAVFEILSNAIDDWNEKVGKYNWELVFCELYAGGKYDNAAGDNYEYSLGLNGLGACATQYASAFMDVTVRRDGKRYDLHFEKGSLVGEMQVAPGGLYPDRHPHGVLHRRPPPPGGGERRHRLPVPGPGGEGLCRDRLCLRKRHRRLRGGTGGGPPPHPHPVLVRGADRAGPAGQARL